jgi:hypothetical protein
LQPDFEEGLFVEELDEALEQVHTPFSLIAAVCFQIADS